MAPATSTEPTILSIKQEFLDAQTRLISQPLQPSRAWRRGNEAAADDENDRRLTERAVDDALFRLNHTLQQHARRVYAPQATRHVAEQIEELYLAFGDRRIIQDDDEILGDDDAWRLVGADYANSEIISSLPLAWESEREVAAYPLEAKRYSETVEQLQELSARKEEAKARVQRLRKMTALLRPFNPDQDPDAGGAANGVQENLVTRDGEIEKELERMRMLLARVGDKVAKVRERAESAEDDEDLFGEKDAMIVEDVEVAERRKVESLLSGMT